jgi:hypothetical protein
VGTNQDLMRVTLWGIMVGCIKVQVSFVQKQAPTNIYVFSRSRTGMKKEGKPMNIKTLSLTIVAGSLLATTAMADYNGLSYDIVEQTGDGAQAGTWTARVFANFDNAVDRLDAVYGNGGNMLTIDSTNGFYQNELGGPTSQSINSAFFPLAPELEWDSYVTIGALYSDGTPFDSNALQNIGIDFSGFETGGAISADNGTWFVTPDDAQGAAGADLRVLVGQFTMNGLDSAVFGTLNLQGKDSAGETYQANGQAFSFSLPAPGALALLGLAGVASRRRRK